MALEQDSGYCLTGDTENNLETNNNVTLHLGDGDIVTSLNQYKISVKGEQSNFVTSRSPEQDVNMEASGHTDKDDSENDAINLDTFESQKENTSESETENLLNSVDDATPLRDAATSDPDLTESANLAIPESESESVQNIKDHCNKEHEQVSPENDDAHNTKEDLNKTENIHTLSNVSLAVKNISNIGEENETETNTFVDSLKPHELDDKSGTSYSLSDAVDSLCTAVSNLENWIGMEKVVEENEEHVKNCKIGEDENISGTDSVLPVIKENKEECKQSLDISLWKPVDERFQNKKEKKDGLINSKQPLNQSKRKTAVFLNKSKESSTIFQQTPSDVSQNKSTSISLDRYSDIMERINQMVMPLHNELFPGRSTQTLRQYSSTQTSPVSQNNSLLYPETTPTAKEHSNTQRSPNKTRSPKSSGKCLIHSIPKLIMCLDCKQKQCPQCILVDGTCQGHTLAEAPHLAIQREKIKLMKALETASCDLNQSEVNMTTVETEIQNLEVKCLLRREEIQQEFTSFMNLLIQQKNTVLQALDQEAEHRKQYLEGFLEQHRALQQKEGQLTDDITSLVQNTGAVDPQPYLKLQSECEKFSSTVKSTLVPESPPITSLLDNPFSLYREKTQFDSAISRDCSKYYRKQHGGADALSPGGSVIPVHPDVTFKRLPFYDIMGELLKPTSLVPRGRSRYQETYFVFRLTPQQAQDIAMSRDFRPAANFEYTVRIQLRFCFLETSCEQDDNFPPSICVRVNGKMAQLPNPIPTTKPGVELKLPGRPVDITSLCRISPTMPNHIEISWGSDFGRGYCVSVNLVKHADHTRALSGDISFRKKTLHTNAGDQLVLDQILQVPYYPTSSTQTYTVELIKFPRTKVWETSVSSLKGLVLNCDTTYCFESNMTYLLRVKVCITIDQSAITKVEKVGKPTHLMIICSEKSQQQYVSDKFTAVEVDSTVTKDGIEESTSDKSCLQCITAMEEYSSKSLEELRLEDYQNTRTKTNKEDIATVRQRSSPSLSNLMESAFCRAS